MKYAMITPVRPGLETLVSIFNMGYHMTLGQHLLRDETYRRFYTDLARRGHFIMVDNGAAEGDCPPFKDVANVAWSIGADEVVMPDVLRDGMATAALWGNEDWRYVPPKKRCVVPQGDSVEEWCEMVDVLTKKDLVFATIGIPKSLERFPGGRAKALEHIRKRNLHEYHHIHMFGVYRNPQEEIMAARMALPGDVRGIDSGCAVAFAQQGKDMLSGEHCSLDMDGGFPSAYVAHNVALMQGWCA